MKDPLFARLYHLTLLATLVMVCVFAAFPGLDLAISGLAYRGEGHFALASVPMAQMVNDLLRMLLNLAAWSIVLLAIGLRFAGRRPQIGRQNLEFAAFVLAVGPGLIVNGLLKEIVGRARPADITAFGGKRVFTPLLQFTDQCMSNCSFTSGEVGMTTAAVMIVLVLCWHLLPKGGRAAALTAGVALICLSITLRVGLGRHFMSDALASVAIVGFVTMWGWRLFDIGTARARITGAALLADLRTLIRPPAAGARRLGRLVLSRQSKP
ncbi:MAG: phosphatase PAP2 family protein [Paracoccus sp. (in: a-proteobacteria)]|nr:phosphatase PAP2 family protein [Paracoccus sp. (in: a-proteobacteria)]